MTVYSRTITAMAWLRQLFSVLLVAPAILMGPLACSGEAFSASESTSDAADIASGNDDAAGVLDTGGLSHDAAIPAIDGSLPKDTGHPSDVTAPGSDVACAVRDACPTGAILPSGSLELWLSADVGVTLTNEKVARWQDRSGLGNDAVQSDPAVRPSVMAAWQAGNPAVTFDAMSTVLVMAPGFADFSKGLSLFVVADITSDQTCPSLVEFSNGGEMDDVAMQEDFSLLRYEVADSALASPADLIPRNKALLLEIVQNASGDVMLLSNAIVVAMGSVPLPNTVTRVKNELGRSSYAGCTLFGGHLAEVVLYRRGLESAERITVEDYLKKKWKL